MLPYLTDQYGNPHSRTHAYGWEAEKAVEDARKVRDAPDASTGRYSLSPQHVADLIGADSKDVVFTSGATETNNMAIKGVARFNKEKKKHVITTQTVGYASFLREFRLTSCLGAQMRSRLLQEAAGRGLRRDLSPGSKERHNPSRRT